MEYIRATMTKPEMRGLRILRDLTYPQRLEADAIINKGADVALLYFWFNLKFQHYRAHPLIDVAKQVRYYQTRDPEFADAIWKWYQEYEGKNEAAIYI